MNYQIYEKLYARYLQHSPQSLIELAGNLEGKNVIDLCSGNGRLSKEVLKQNPSGIILADKDYDMIEPSLFDNKKIIVLVFYEWSFLINCIATHEVDVIFCQQAINYWLSNETVKHVISFLKSGGLFIFNTFNQKPSIEPSFKRYQLDGRWYRELSFLEGPMVYHIQMCQGMDPDINVFQWISPEDYQMILSPYFKIETFIKGPTTLYRCTYRKDI